MKRNEWIAIGIVGFAIGTIIVLSTRLNSDLTLARIGGGPTAYIPTPEVTHTIVFETEVPSLSIDTEPSQPALAYTDPLGDDVSDVLLLYYSRGESSFSTNFCMLAEFYGLTCKKAAIDKNTLTTNLLKDETGKPYRLIALDAETISARNPMVNREQLVLLKQAVEQGSHLLVSKLDSRTNANAISTLTGGAVKGLFVPMDTIRDWHVSSDEPLLTNTFTGITVLSPVTSAPASLGISFSENPNLVPIIQSTDDLDEMYTTFLLWRSPGGGSVFLDGGEIPLPFDRVALREVYYSAASFSQVIPTMMAIRYSMGEEAWHSPTLFANLTIDEAVLKEPYVSLNYTALLEMMKIHGYHTTAALIPATWEESTPEVIALFLTNPNYFSLAQFGNTGDGYEFYRYASESGTNEASTILPVKPIEEQEEDILEGMARMALHANITRIPEDPVMIFPGGICPEPTIGILKRNNFLGMVNAQDVPLDADRPTNWDYGMDPAILDYQGFPNLVRRLPERDSAVQPPLLSSLMDLFLGKPALFYSYPYGRGLFAQGMDSFSPVADQLNALPMEIEWRSLGFILRHLSLTKTNDDGSVSLRMYSRELFYVNPTADDLPVHITRAESASAEQFTVLVNKREVNYQFKDEMIHLDLLLPAYATMEVEIVYH